ncbi:MAG: hypothetical protein FJ253_01330 [Phycisphaerae bacterium]|nr:hypothetical protein [Phycisphaerae bacterium]
MTARGRPGAGGRRAVTLIEVLVVLGLLAAMLALALPITLRSIERNTYRAAVAAVVASIDEARSHAQREGVMVEVIVARDGSRLRAMERPVDGGDAAPITMIDAAIDPPITLASAAGDGLLALFLPDGSAPISGTATIRSADGVESIVSIGATLGRASVTERVVSEEEPEEDAVEEKPAESAPTTSGATGSPTS